jgi:tetratricopeptide (TPR) repeat protein
MMPSLKPRVISVFVAVVLLLWGSLAWGERPTVSDPERAQTLERVKALLMLHDSFKAIEFMASLGTPERVAQRYLNLVDDLYWKEKDITSVMIMGRAGIQEILTAATDVDSRDPSGAARLRGMAKSLAYNLASYVWPGWDEPGILIKADYLLVGYDAARLNLRLALELEKAAVQVSIAYWMLAVQQVALKRYDEAIKAFGLSLDKAKEAKQPAYQYLALGFIALSELAMGSEGEGSVLKFAEARRQLEALKTREGDLFASQLVTAARVFLGNVPAETPLP